MKSLLARMGATSISTVVNHVEELAMQVHRPTDCQIFIIFDIDNSL